MKLPITSAFALAILALTAVAQGASVPVTNFSFETNVITSGTGIIFPNPAGWTNFTSIGSTGNFDVGLQRPVGGSPPDYTVGNPIAAPGDGNQFLWVNKFNGSGTGGVFQDVGALQANTLYTLTVAIGSRNDRINSPGIISLWNGTSNLGSLLGSASGIPATQNTWQDFTFNFTTGAVVSGDLTIGLSVLDAGTIQANFDNVRLTAVSAVPEPSTYGVAMAVLLAGLILVRRRSSAVRSI